MPRNLTLLNRTLSVSGAVIVPGNLLMTGSTRFERLDRTPLPAIAQTVEGEFVVLARVDSDQVLYQDPRAGRPQQCGRDEWLVQWNGKLILITSRASLTGALARFDFSCDES